MVRAELLTPFELRLDHLLLPVRVVEPAAPVEAKCLSRQLIYHGLEGISFQGFRHPGIPVTEEPAPGFFPV